jgi:hypothetical protein|tara:strand:+ start:1984 stop:2664 length:681 start_codon:yes stop_codon:yes gene_type:complete
MAREAGLPPCQLPPLFAHLAFVGTFTVSLTTNGINNMASQLTIIVDNKCTLIHFTSTALQGSDNNAWFNISAEHIKLNNAILDTVSYYLRVSGIATKVHYVTQTTPCTYSVTYTATGHDTEMVSKSIIELMKLRTDVQAGVPVTISRCPFLGISWTPEIVCDDREVIVEGVKAYAHLVAPFEKLKAEDFAERIMQNTKKEEDIATARLIASLAKPQTLMTFEEIEF